MLPAFTENECRITDAMEMIRPHMEFTFNNILAHINTVFVLRTKFGSYNENGKEYTRFVWSLVRICHPAGPSLIAILMAPHPPLTLECVSRDR